MATDPTGYISIPLELVRGMAWKRPVRCATTASITISTALNVGDSIDGVTLADGDRVLVKDQSTGSQNGIYVAGATPARAFDMDQDLTTGVPAEEIAGAFVYVLAGTAGAGKIFHTTNVGGGTLGSTTITWTEFSGGSGAPTTADYLVGTAQGGLSAEIVVGTTPGGELGGTWASPTVDGTHSGSAHTDFIAKSLLTTQDDIIVRDGTGPARLAKGSDGQVLTVDPTTHHLVWATPSAGSGDVATDTIWDAKGDLAGGTGSDTAARLAVGSDGDVLTADSGETTGMKWAAPTGGGGLTQAYVGYNTIGGTWESMTERRVYAKKVTIANACLISDIEAYIQGHTSDSVSSLSVALFDDASGTPDNLIQYSFNPVTTALLDDTTGAGGIDHPRWLGVPLGRWVAAADYWIAVQAWTNASSFQIAKDGSGSDRHYTSGGGWFIDWGWATPTTTTDRYSIRANTIR